MAGAQEVIALGDHLVEKRALWAGQVVALAEDGGHDVVEQRGVQHAPQGDLAVAAATSESMASPMETRWCAAPATRRGPKWCAAARRRSPRQRPRRPTGRSPWRGGTAGAAPRP